MSNQQSEAQASFEALSAYSVGQVVNAVSAELSKGRTSPPPRYTQAALINDMTNAWKFARTKEERDMLRATEGIGTSRTRDQMLENLINRKLITSKKVGRRHEIISSDIGRDIVGRLPAWLIDVATTAKWEVLLAAIEKGEAEMEQAIAAQVEYVKQVVQRAKNQVGKSA